MPEFCTGTLQAYVAFVEMNNLYEVQGIDPTPGDAISASVTYLRVGQVPFLACRLDTAQVFFAHVFLRSIFIRSRNL